MAAHAAVWGYVDDTGVAHVASEKLDERYQLFFKGGTNVAAAEAAAVASAEARAAFERTPAFQRVMAHPGLARFEPLIENNMPSRSSSIPPW